MEMWEVHADGTAGALRGRPLRYVLVQIMYETHTPMSIPELIEACEAAGVIFDGRASKIISDALRWEVRRGRIIRLGRGIYIRGVVPRGTLWRIRKRVAEYREFLEQLTPPIWQQLNTPLLQ